VTEGWRIPLGSGEQWTDDYERGRPGWPAEALDVVPVRQDAAVLELGAGTGKLTRLLVDRYDRVTAVEPQPAMRRLLVPLCPDADVVVGNAEEIPAADASVDAVFAAEAFHRFVRDRAVPEIARVLRPGGWLVLMWNLPGGATEPSIVEAERFLAELAPGGLPYDPLDLNTDTYSSGAWRQAFEGFPFAPLREASVPNPQTINRDGLVAFFASMGWIADLRDAERLPLLDDLRSRLPDTTFRRPWTTHVHWTRICRLRRRPRGAGGGSG
jgi:SAM-dependent methyltransferase